MLRSPAHIALVACCLALPVAGHAQGFGQGGGLVSQGFQPPVKGGGEVPKPGLPPPPALPGATGTAPAAPPEHLPTDLSPNDALFDAIDRGDMAAARDALSRGADLDAVNVLGMTPLEASVDLGRNDITFLLLSLRGAASSGRAAVVGAGPGGPSAGGKPDSGRIAVAARVTASRAAARPITEAAQPRVRYTVTDNSAADPKDGFLGFGPSTQP